MEVRAHLAGDPRGDARRRRLTPYIGANEAAILLRGASARRGPDSFTVRPTRVSRRREAPNLCGASPYVARPPWSFSVAKPNSFRSTLATLHDQLLAAC